MKQKRPRDASKSGRRPKGLVRFGFATIIAGALLLGGGALYVWATGQTAREAQQDLIQSFEARAATTTEPEVVQSSTIVIQPAAQPSTSLAPTTTVEGVQPPPSTTVPPLPVVIEEAAPPEGEPIGHIEIEKLGVDWTVIEGTESVYLTMGPGHMPGTPLPGQPGNAVISGHRTTYGAPFAPLGEITVGDTVAIETLIGRHSFVVRETLIVQPNDMSVVEPRDGAWLTLTTCEPPGRATYRLIVVAELVEGPNAAAIAAISALVAAS